MELDSIDYKNEKILIVDDDPYIRDTLEKLLSAINLSSTSAGNGRDALNLLSKGEYTVVLTDMKMPGMDGMELISRVSSNFDISVIAMTGHLEGYKYLDVINAGASDFIKKPFGIEELEAK
ncbi:MAG: response regulator, partial [Deltaproteobacteria bacterium]|nr:response regulator [Deltaproteobacteria bacterium]